MTRKLSAQSIPTRVFKTGENLNSFLVESIRHACSDLSILEGSILAITSKIVSLSENRVVSKNEISKEALVKREADQFLGEIAYGCFLTIKHGLFIASAGIDESNSEEGHYILFPAKPFESARLIRSQLMEEFQLQNLGVIITDSHTSPLRAGVTGITLAHAGFRGVRNFVGSPDLFGRELHMTRVNVADALSSAAVFCMGEANESTPLALLHAEVQFTSELISEDECTIAADRDLYSPLYRKMLS